jgi:hypothetical protein
MKIVICIDPGQDLNGVYGRKQNDNKQAFRLLSTDADSTFLLLELGPGPRPVASILLRLDMFFQCKEYLAWRGDDKELFVWVHRSDVNPDEVKDWPSEGHRAQALPLDDQKVPIVVASRLGRFAELWNAILAGQQREEHGQCIRDIATGQGSGHRANDGGDSGAPNGPSAPDHMVPIRVHRAAELLLHELNGIIAVMRLNREGGQEGGERIKRRLRTALDHKDELMAAAEVVRVRPQFESGIKLVHEFCSTTDDGPHTQQVIEDRLEQIRKNVLEQSARQEGKSQ